MPQTSGTVQAARTLPSGSDPLAVRTTFASDPREWLPGPGRAAVGEVQLRLTAGPVVRIAHATVGDVVVDGDTVSRRLRWRVPSPEDPTVDDRRLPAFDGVLVLHLTRERPVVIQIDGSYEPPGGAVGGVVDRLMGRHVANLTADTLLSEVIDALVSDSRKPQEAGYA